MSGLKAIHVADAFDNFFEHPSKENSKVYLKSEADKVIAEKDAEIANLANKLHNKCRQRADGSNMSRKLVSQLSLFEGRKVNVYRKADVDALLTEKDARIRKLLDDVQKQNLELQHCYKRIHRLSVEKYFFEQNERNYVECIDANAVEIAELKAQLEQEPARSPVDFEVLTEEQMESRRLGERAK